MVWGWINVLGEGYLHFCGAEKYNSGTSVKLLHIWKGMAEEEEVQGTGHHTDVKDLLS